MIEWFRRRWTEITTQPCPSCGETVLVTEFAPTGEQRKDTWWAGGAIEVECPSCGFCFWVKK